MSTLLSTLLAVAFSMSAAFATPPVPYAVSLHSWRAEPGDRVIVDTLNNEGYIFHTDGRYLRFPVVTGQRRWVYYIGRSYNASTPNWDWTIKDMDIKGDRLTFGPSGRFLRLFKNGERRTAYGFHEYGDEAEMFDDAEASERFRSMGCIIVRVPIMNLLVDTFEQNGSIEVITKHGIEDLKMVMAEFKEEEKNVEEGEEIALY